ncbi:hypothetical protein BDA99DRAFT_544032 [Phascolomyces articulosus]|uniref:Uncharacterized protein n=1 Tax=Phascolomyces articulosus TaxID=60185 RepID=A0AAD5JLF0_9FUNG|nr:hypothetical protein BDA99DRAFT_544032 [Phascolomyces articulosus]
MSQMQINTPTHLQETISLVQERAAESQLDLTDASREILQNIGTSTNHADLLRLATDSASISDEEMSRILHAQLQVDNADLSAGPNPITQYYIRSIGLQCRQFSSNLQDYNNDYYDEAYVQGFQEYLSSKGPDEMVYIRYIGYTSASTPLKRQWDDNNSRGKRRYCNLYHIITKHGLLHQVVYSFPTLQANGRYSVFEDPNRQLIDQTEQMLIHLFGRDLLMNSQPGGFYHQYVQKLQEARIVVQEWRRLDATQRLEKTILRNGSLPDHDFFSACGRIGGKLGYQIHYERYGDAESGDRRLIQLRTLLRYNDGLLRRSLSFNTDKEQFKKWFLGLETGTNIYQAIIRLIHIEHHSAVGNLTSAQVQYLRVQCKPPQGFDDGDDSWMLNPYLVSVALKERVGVMWTGTTPAKREANKRNLLARLNVEGKKAIDYFIRVPINLLANGRAHIRVNLDGEEMAEPDGLWIIGSGANMRGQYILDYDPKICTIGLVVKDLQGNLMPSQSNHIIISDQWLLTNSRDKYFRTFANTIRLFGYELRPTIKEEAECSVPFSDERMVQLFMERYCNTSDLVVTTSKNSQGNIPTFQSLMENCLEAEGTSLEKEIWNHWMTMATGYAKIKKLFNKFQKLPPSDKNRKTWTIPQLKHEPFLEWWRQFHNNTNGGIVYLDFTDITNGFWGEFATIEQQRGLDDEAIHQYIAVRNIKKPQSSNALVKRYGWIVNKVKNGIFIWYAPNEQPPDQPMRKRPRRTNIS